MMLKGTQEEHKTRATKASEKKKPARSRVALSKTPKIEKYEHSSVRSQVLAQYSGTLKAHLLMTNQSTRNMIRL